jgi:hypothetical protein
MGPVYTGFGLVNRFIEHSEAIITNNYYSLTSLHTLKITVLLLLLLLLFIIGVVGLSPLCTAATSVLLYKPQMIDGDCGAIGGMQIGRGKPKYSEKTCPSTTLSTTNPT